MYYTLVLFLNGINEQLFNLPEENQKRMKYDTQYPFL